MNNFIAQSISAVFNPIITPLVTFSLLGVADQQLNLSEKIEFSGIADLFASGLIILCLFIFLRVGLINSPDIPDRKQRSLPLIVAATILFVGFVTLFLIHAPSLFQALMWCYATETLIVAIISHWWKISIHTASMACSLVTLTYCFGTIVLPFYLLLLLVAEARIVLKKHTIAQASAGAVLGIVLTVIQLLSFKLA